VAESVTAELEEGTQKNVEEATKRLAKKRQGQLIAERNAVAQRAKVISLLLSLLLLSFCDPSITC